jgi:hypothetical protein
MRHDLHEQRDGHIVRVYALLSGQLHLQAMKQVCPHQYLHHFPFGAPELAELQMLFEHAERLFADPGCGHCTVLFPEVGRWQRDYASKLTLTVISRGSLEANQSKVSVHGITRVLLQQQHEVQPAYQVTSTPSAMIIRPDGSTGSRLAQGVDAIRSLVAATIGLPRLRSVPRAATASQRNGHGATAVPRRSTDLKIGEAAPDFSLPDLSGNLVHLSDFPGEDHQCWMNLPDHQTGANRDSRLFLPCQFGP